MKRFTIKAAARGLKKTYKITAEKAKHINAAMLYKDTDGYLTHTGRVNRKQWQIMLLQLVARGYTADEAYREIKKLGIQPETTQTMYNYLSNIKKADGNIRFRVNEMTQGAVDTLRHTLKKSHDYIPRNVSKKAGEKMFTEKAFSDMVGRESHAGRLTKDEETARKKKKPQMKVARKRLKISVNR